MPLDPAEELQEAQFLRDHPQACEWPPTASARAPTAVKPGPQPGWAGSRRGRGWGLARASGADQAGRPSGAPAHPSHQALGPSEPVGGTAPGATARVALPGPTPGTKRGPGRAVSPHFKGLSLAPTPAKGGPEGGSSGRSRRTPGAGVRRQVRPGSPQPRPVQPPLRLAVEGDAGPGAAQAGSPWGPRGARAGRSTSWCGCCGPRRRASRSADRS